MAKLNWKRHQVLPVSTKLIQSMVDAGWLTFPPEGRIPIDYLPGKPKQDKRYLPMES